MADLRKDWAKDIEPDKLSSLSQRIVFFVFD